MCFVFTLPVDSTPELIEKQGGTPANFQMSVPSCLFTLVWFVTLPAGSTPEFINKQVEMPANFQIPWHPVWLQCVSPRPPPLGTCFDDFGTVWHHFDFIWAPFGAFGHHFGSIHANLHDLGHHSESTSSAGVRQAEFK